MSRLIDKIDYTTQEVLKGKAIAFHYKEDERSNV